MKKYSGVRNRSFDWLSNDFFKKMRPYPRKRNKFFDYFSENFFKKMWDFSIKIGNRIEKNCAHFKIHPWVGITVEIIIIILIIIVALLLKIIVFIIQPISKS
jgi:hypothetical protein